MVVWRPHGLIDDRWSRRRRKGRLELSQDRGPSTRRVGPRHGQDPPSRRPEMSPTGPITLEVVIPATVGRERDTDVRPCEVQTVATSEDANRVLPNRLRKCGRSQQPRYLHLEHVLRRRSPGDCIEHGTQLRRSHASASAERFEAEAQAIVSNQPHAARALQSALERLLVQYGRQIDDGPRRPCEAQVVSSARVLRRKGGASDERR